MRNHKRAAARFRIKVISAAVASCFAADLALANPTGPAVANGQVTFHQQGNLLQITNSPNAIINWQSFSIGSSEITRFLQQSASSAVLNRVITQNPSSILGALQSNGRVFLINPNGILFGPGSQIDVAGLVASTLNLSDTDFLAGRLRFTEVPGAGSLINQGAINAASGGSVYLVGPAVRNEGLITSSKGDVILAAGNSVELVNPGTPDLRVEITAPDNEALNLGQIAADAGRVGIYAGLINQSGTVQANTAEVTEDGRIVLKATKGVDLEARSVTAASGVRGGNLTVETETGTIRVAGKLDASGSAAGGSINLAVTGTSGGIDLSNGLNAGNAAINVSGTGHTVTLSGDMVTAGAPIDIADSVILGAPANITLDTTNGGAVAGGANITITGAVDDDVAGPTGLVMTAGTAGVNTVGGAIGGVMPIASLTTNGSETFLNGGVVTTTGDQTYNSPVTQAPGNLTINAGGDIAIGGNIFSGSQVINAAGNITLTPGGPGSANVSAGGSQTVTTGGTLTLQGAPTGINSFARLSAAGDQIITAAGISVTGGAGSGNLAEVRQLDPSSSQTITITDGGTLALQGGSGESNNFARIRNQGLSQEFHFPAGGAILLTGGSGVSNDFAHIDANSGTQTITGSPAITLLGGTGGLDGLPNRAQIRAVAGPQTIYAGETTLTAGASGFGNNAVIQSPLQTIYIDGNLTMTGGGSVSTANNSGPARIGGLGDDTPTNLLLTVTGDLLMNGGNAANAGAVIGSNFLGGQPTEITMEVGGNLTLGTGTAPFSSARIGSPSMNIAGGNILINAGGDITLDNANVAGTRSVIRTLDSLTLSANNISVGGSLISGAQAINATGNVTVSAPNAVNALVSATGPQSITAGGTLTVQGGAETGLSASITGSAGQAISASNINVTGGAGGAGSFADIRQLGGGFDQTITVTGGGTLALQGGSGTDSFARIRNDGLNQTINAPGGAIVITGGIGPNELPNPEDTSNNFARIENRSFVGMQAVNAGTITLNGGLAGASNFTGIQAAHQVITTTGDVTLHGGPAFNSGSRFGAVGNTSPTDLVLNVGGNLTLMGGAATRAAIGSNREGNQPTDIVVTAAGDITLDTGLGAGARIGSPSIDLIAGGNISLTSTGGDIVLNGGSSILALGEIAINTPGNLTLSSGTGTNLGARILGGDNQTLNASNIVLTGGVGTNNPAQIYQTGATGSQSINAASISVIGGSGGADSFASIRNDGVGAQTITGLPVITLVGGTDGAPDQGNYAEIRASGMQSIQAGDTSMTAGASGFSNSAIIKAPQQVINVNGDLTMVGGGATTGVAQGAGVRIGGLQATQSGGVVIAPPSPTDLLLTVSGDVTISGGSPSGAAIGSSTLGGTAPSNIAMSVGGDLTLNTGLGAGVRIGSSLFNLVPGSIVINAGTSGVGDIVLNGRTGIQALGEITVSTPGDLILTGGMGVNQRAQILGVGNQTVSANNISLTGGAAGEGNFADIRQLGGGFNQAITVTGGGTLSLQGGSDGLDNFARVRNDGLNQTINAAGGAIVITGGIGPNDLPNPLATTNNFARIENRSLTGLQTVNAHTIGLNGGPMGQSNFAGLQAAHQLITTTGDVTLVGGGGESSGARIGAVGNLSATDVVLNVGGSLMLTGGDGSGATIGSNPDGGRTTDIVVTAAGDITTNPGLGSGVRIGSPSGPGLSGGNIWLTTTGGNIALNSGGGFGTAIRTLDNVTLAANAISQGADSLIRANQLTTTTNAGTSLGGNNRVSVFNASNSFSGDVFFNNTSALLTVTGINQTPFGALTLIQDGDLTLTGFIFSGPQSISATGDILVTPSSPAVVNAFGPQLISAGGGLKVESSPLGDAQITADGGQTIDASYIEVTAQGGHSAFISNFVSGDQVLTTHGANTAGEGIVVRNKDSGFGVALIDQQAFGFGQSISVHNADYMRVIGEGGTAQVNAGFGGATQTISLTGPGKNALEIGAVNATGNSFVFGNTQTITAGLPAEQGSIMLQGGAMSGAATVIQNLDGAQTIAASGTVRLEGGTGAGPSFTSLSNFGGGTQNISAHALALHGGDSGAGNGTTIFSSGYQEMNIGAGGINLVGGADGANNFTQVIAFGSGGQRIYAAGIKMEGGAAGSGNNAFIDAVGGPQEINAGAGGLAMKGGGGASQNWALILHDINATGDQTVTVDGGSLAMIAGNSGGTNYARILNRNPGGNQMVTVHGGNIALSGGNGGTSNFADIFQQDSSGDQSVAITGGGTLLMQGGLLGADNFARVRNNGLNQHIYVPGGAIIVSGGSNASPDTGGNFARIENRGSGTQTVNAGTIAMTGGPAGDSNFAGIQAAHQRITTTGDVTLVGGGGTVTGARIGAVGATTPTDLILNVGGSLNLTGGSSSDATLGANREGNQPTNIVVTSSGDITLNPGTSAGAEGHIGSPSVDLIAGGNISLTSTGGNIAMNSAGGIGTSILTLGDVALTANAITQGEDSTIHAKQLTTVSNAGASLGGYNQVAVFNATNGASGGVLLNNGSQSLTVTGVSTIPGPFTLMQDGDLAIIGDVWSGPQTINVSGDMIVGSDSNSVILYAAGPRTVMGRGEPHASWKALGVGLLDRLAGHSPINISARSLSVKGGSEFGSFAAITGGPINITTTGNKYNGDFSLAGGSGFGAFGWVLSSQDVNLNIGGKLRLDSGTGFLSFARIQTVRPKSKIKVYFPNLSSGGYYVNGVQGAFRNGLSGFYTGPHAAKPGKGLLTDYGL